MSNNLNDFAIIKEGGKQYKVMNGMVLDIEKRPEEIGEKIKLDNVLLVSRSNDTSFIGSPIVDGAYVTGEVVRHYRGAKVLVYKKKRRKGYTRTMGHRQSHTTIKIIDINKD